MSLGSQILILCADGKFCITTKHFIIGLRRTSIPNFHFQIPNSHFSIFDYPPFIPPRNTIAKSAETSKKC